MTNTHFKSR